MAKWFYKKDGQQSGPIDAAELKQLATAGRLKPTEKIRRSDAVCTGISRTSYALLR